MIVKKVQAAGKAAGIIAPNATVAKRLIEQGFRYIVLGSDQAFIQGMGKMYMNELK